MKKEIYKEIINKTKNNKEKIVFVFYIISILVFEIFYCNGKIFNDGKYNFSLCRISFYIIFILVFLKFKLKFFKNLDKSFENKFKRILIYTYIFLSIIFYLIFIIMIKKIEIGLIAIFFILMFICGIFIILVSEDLIKNLIITVFTFGIVFSCVTTFNHNFDERKHFMTAFNISVGNFNYQKEYVCDEQILDIKQIERFEEAVKKFDGVYNPKLSKEIELDAFSTPTDNSFILYIPSAIGMCLARILRGSLLDMYIAGRIFNLLTYMILAILTLKLLPYKKNIYYLICTMPIIILLAASYSIDALSLSLISLFVANILRLYEKENINIKEIVFLVLSVVLLIIAKSMAYIGIGLIVFILPLKKVIKQNKKYLPIIIAILIALLVILGLLLFNINIKADTRSENTDSSGQIEYLLNNPFQIVSTLYRHTRDTLFNLGWLEDLNPQVFFYSFYKCVFMVMFLIFFVIAINDESKKFKIKDKMIFLITFFVVFAMTSFALYIGFTGKGERNIIGYQARYLIPILPLILICLNNNLIKIKIKCEEKQLMSIIWGGLTLIDLIGLIML